MGTGSRAFSGEWLTASYFGVSGKWGLITAGDGTLRSPKQCRELDDTYRVGTRSGVLFEDSWIRIADIEDGLATTLMIGERGVPQSRNSGWLSGPGLADACPGGWTDALLPFEDNLGYSGWGSPIGDKLQSFRWWSHHPNGQNFVMCDGTVRLVSRSIDMETLLALSTRQGHESVSESSW